MMTLKLGTLLPKPPCNLFGNIQRPDVVRELGASFVGHRLGIHQIEMIARQVQSVEFPVRNARYRGFVPARNARSPPYQLRTGTSLSQ
ncbi:hypothetical protein ACVWXN_000235 [Bradyrhizobium sp. i1.4.4]